ncbi:unnamed protein product [Orchesella dallaii]|uniref:Uncharacterized protein n=1 Tax=Orchesella dallaii TaxID=48710 RepID=A0ABP1S7K6_9HEXA
MKNPPKTRNASTAFEGIIVLLGSLKNELKYPPIWRRLTGRKQNNAGNHQSRRSHALPWSMIEAVMKQTQMIRSSPPSKLSVIPPAPTDNNLLTNINLVRTNTHDSLPFMKSSEAAGNSAEAPTPTPVTIDFDSLIHDERALISLAGDCPLQQTHVPRQPSATLPEQSSVSSSTFASLFSRQIEFEEHVLTALTSIKADVRELLQRSGSNVIPEDTLTRRLPLDLPLKTIDSLMKLDDWTAVSDN